MVAHVRSAMELETSWWFTATDMRASRGLTAIVAAEVVEHSGASDHFCPAYSRGLFQGVIRSRTGSLRKSFHLGTAEITHATPPTASPASL